MIARSNDHVQTERWQETLRDAFTDPFALLRALDLSPEAVDLDPDGAGFPFRVPRPFVTRMTVGDASDPLLLQVIPRRAERHAKAGYSLDPLAETGAGANPALLQKYPGRALLITTGACAINCRYCFRRHFPYAETRGNAVLDRALATIAADTSLAEVILSGGDPLILSDGAIADLLTRLGAIEHLKRVRLHSRLVVTIPNRVTDRLLDTLLRSRLQTVMVIHANHPREIDDQTADAMRRFVRAAIPVFNQSVLLKAVNDDAATLVALSERLFTAGVMPYYVHLLDPVAGASHFEVPMETARRIAAAMRARLPGYLMPRFVREIPGEPSKQPVF
jgi:EF-P beta-lysylation protein EpmB